MKKERYRIAIIDYQMGNLFSVAHACSYVGLDPIITHDKNIILKSDAIILPGVGAFSKAMENIKKFKLNQIIKLCIEENKPLLAICLGMQLLFTESYEFGKCRGLNIIKGKVIQFNNDNRKVPQIGWNTIYPPSNLLNKWNNSILNNIKKNEFMYFVHSFYVIPNFNEIILSSTNYEGIEYCSSIQYNNIYATQFHPEKSGPQGIKIYLNWANEIKQNRGIS